MLCLEDDDGHIENGLSVVSPMTPGVTRPEHPLPATARLLEVGELLVAVSPSSRRSRIH
jgi:hypothetical protein